MSDKLSVDIKHYSPQQLHSHEVEVDFSKEPTEAEWDELFAKAKMFPKCNGQCLSGYGPDAKRYDGNNGKCIYCGYQK